MNIVNCWGGGGGEDPLPDASVSIGQINFTLNTELLGEGPPPDASVSIGQINFTLNTELLGEGPLPDASVSIGQINNHILFLW